jgi:hypothetical protein
MARPPCRRARMSFIPRERPTGKAWQPPGFLLCDASLENWQWQKKN